MVEAHYHFYLWKAFKGHLLNGVVHLVNRLCFNCMIAFAIEQSFYAIFRRVIMKFEFH